MRRTAKAWVGAWMLIALGATSAWAAQGPLVKQAGEGAFEPGIVTAWQEQPNGVLLTIGDAADAAQVATLLGDRLAGIEIAREGDTQILVSGMPLAGLLGQLSHLSLGDEVDPLADLTGLGGNVVAMQRPEAGGSIRASRPTAIAPPPRVEHPAAERLVAKVLDVQRGPFPHAGLKLKVTRAATAGELRTKLKRSASFEAEVQLFGEGDAIDYANADNQRNLVAYYLRAGDSVVVHVVLDGEAMRIDWIERAPAK